MRKFIALVGLGPHAMRIYYPYIEGIVVRDEEATFDLLIDLETNREKIEAFLDTKQVKPGKIIFLNQDEQINPKQIHPSVAEAFRELNINRAIIATEPKAHKVYLEECIRQGIPAITDKPITAPINLISSISAAEEIYDDVAQLATKVQENPDARILVQCQRRNHEGYKKVFEVAESTVKEYGMPITYISIHHSDGMWNMPDELFYRENHPYKYGYGKLMHSGYHFIDLLSTLLRLNNQIEAKKPDSMALFSEYSRAIDQQSVITNSDYSRFFGKDAANRFEDFSKNEALADFGEVDSFTQLQLMKDGRIITTAQLSLMQSGFSQRAWPDLPADAYKSNGRIRHEYVNIHIGPLMSIQVHSYQSKQIGEQSISSYEAGGNNHFDIYIFRNSNLIGGEAFEKIEYGSDDLMKTRESSYLGHNEYARFKLLDELMYNLPSNSEIADHLATNKLLSEIYKNHSRQTNGDVPYSKISAKEIL